MKEIYSTFEEKLGVNNREGYTISITKNGNICMMQYKVMSNAQQGKWIFIPTSEYNKDTTWDMAKCLDLLCDIADNKINLLLHTHH